jgi:hypothetical protein
VHPKGSPVSTRGIGVPKIIYLHFSKHSPSRHPLAIDHYLVLFLQLTGTAKSPEMGNFGCTFAFELSVDRWENVTAKRAKPVNQGNSGFVRGRGNQANGTAFRNGRPIGKGGAKSRLFLNNMAACPAVIVVIQIKCN